MVVVVVVVVVVVEDDELDEDELVVPVPSVVLPWGMLCVVVVVLVRGLLGFAHETTHQTKPKIKSINKMIWQALVFFICISFWPL